MESTASPTLLKFVEQITHSSNKEAGQLTINDLVVGVRQERLSEVGTWSNSDLDLIEAHASLFSYTDPIESVLQSSAAEAEKVTCISSPSPVAWF